MFLKHSAKNFRYILMAHGDYSLSRRLLGTGVGGCRYLAKPIVFKVDLCEVKKVGNKQLHFDK